MITYAQNFEDVLLERCFKSVDDGFFIDVGAWDPVADSVTYHFYKRGWRGVNIEPNPAFCERLREIRPDDVNLQVAVGDQPGRAKFYNLSEPRLSTLLPSQLERLSTFGFSVSEEYTDVVTLRSVCEQYARGRIIHFMKIDVEGMEETVIDSADWSRFRPLVIVIEATLPYSSIPAWDTWEPKLLEKGYTFAWFDGLNRFYVESSHPELLAHFTVPPNCTDMFVPAQVANLEERLVQAGGSPKMELASVQDNSEIASVDDAEMLDPGENSNTVAVRATDAFLRLLNRLDDMERHHGGQIGPVHARVLEFFGNQDRVLAKLELQDALVTSLRSRIEAEVRALSDSTRQDHARFESLVAEYVAALTKRVTETLAVVNGSSGSLTQRIDDLVSPGGRLDAIARQTAAAMAAHHSELAQHVSRELALLGERTAAAIRGGIEGLLVASENGVSSSAMETDRVASQLGAMLQASLSLNQTETEDLTSSIRSHMAGMVENGDNRAAAPVTGLLGAIRQELSKFGNVVAQMSAQIAAHLQGTPEQLVQTVRSEVSTPFGTVSGQLDAVASSVSAQATALDELRATLMQQTTMMSFLHTRAVDDNRRHEAETKRLEAVISVQKQEFKTALAELSDRANQAILDRHAAQATIEQLAGENEESRRENADLLSRTVELRNQLDYARSRVAELERATARVSDLERELAGRNDLIQHMERTLEATRQTLTVVENNVAQLNNRVHAEQQARVSAEHDAEALRQSLSWKITAPLRGVYGTVSRR